MNVFLFEVGGRQDEAVVAARTKAEAAELFGVSPYVLRAYGCTALPADDWRHRVAMSAPGVVWCRPRTVAAEDRLRGFLPWRPADRTPKPDVVVNWNVNADRGEWRFDWWEWHGWPAERREVELNDRMQDEIANHVDAGYAVVEGPAAEAPR